ncbi:MAG: MFS transporter, partial [Deltaproteobacteria bacterium]|nr:MFS transporter [Deltaproteobacteria bacterium]
MPSALTGQERIDFWILSSGQFLLFCGFFSFFQFPLYIQHQGGDEVQIGVIMGVTSLASTLLLPWIIALVDRVERRRVMLIGMILMEAATMACIATEAPDVFMGTLMVLRGFGIAVYMNASGAYIAQILPPEEKSRWIGINFGFNQIAIGVGPLLGDLIITRVGFPFFFFMATAFIFSGMLFILTITSRVPEPVERPFHPLESLTYFFREINGPRFRVPFITLLLVAGVVSAVFNFTATFMQKIGLPSGVFFTVYAGVNVMCRFFISGRTDRLPRWLVVVPSLGVMALGLLAYSVTANL